MARSELRAQPHGAEGRAGLGASLAEEEAIRALSLTSRSRRASLHEGQHPSRSAGSGTDFRDHRPYTPGDDIRWIDWRLHARTDRDYVRQYERTTLLRVTVGIDDSMSMDYGSGSTNKLHYAMRLGWVLARKGAEQGDRISALSAFGPDRPATTDASLRWLSTLQPRTGTAGAATLARLSHEGARPDILVLISDWLDAEAPEALRQAVPLRGSGTEVRIVHLIHPDERDFPFSGIVRFDDGEGLPPIEADAAAASEGYRAAFARHAEAVAEAASAAGFDYARFYTDGNLVSAAQFVLTGDAPRAIAPMGEQP